MTKKGFTLIELLAVLVVLAILALISIPITIRIINNARENSYKRSIANYGKIFEKVIALDNMGNAREDFKSLSSYESEVEKNYSGNRVQCDLDESEIVDGKIILRYCTVDENAYYKYENGKVSIMQVYEEYHIGDQITVAGEQYYIIDNSNKKKDYVTALKVLPLKATEIEAAGGSVPYTYNDDNKSGQMTYYSSQNCIISDESGCTTDYSLSNINSVLESWAQTKFKNNELIIVDGYSVRLISVEELERLGYRIDGTGDSFSDNIPSGIYNISYGYWTMSAYPQSDLCLWYVTSYGVSYGHVRGYGGVRPIINVYKSKISS